MTEPMYIPPPRVPRYGRRESDPTVMLGLVMLFLILVALACAATAFAVWYL
jgi:hypothetical protein